ncbi:hypothetical protein PGS49_21025 [Yersinia intermedia]|uniref:hypothetical protein n=1 Tax=Yersinia intermedia TaxID=631 RepID=UPI0022FEF49C|nr:hypothetical protein [Yersinia intermedia]MDA5483105.1 hypothetical protein [Yersinia intermedia]
MRYIQFIFTAIYICLIFGTNTVLARTHSIECKIPKYGDPVADELIAIVNYQKLTCNTNDPESHFSVNGVKVSYIKPDDLTSIILDNVRGCQSLDTPMYSPKKNLCTSLLEKDIRYWASSTKDPKMKKLVYPYDLSSSEKGSFNYLNFRLWANASILGSDAKFQQNGSSDSLNEVRNEILNATK